MYTGEHAIIFGNKHSWEDWHLYPAKRYVIPPPKKKTNLVDIPGANGSLDLSEALTGYPIFENRTGTLSFIIEHDYYKRWVDTYEEIVDYLHGRHAQMILEDDPNYYFEGAFEVSNWNDTNIVNHSSIDISYDLKPYRYSMEETVVNLQTHGGTILVNSSTGNALTNTSSGAVLSTKDVTAVEERYLSVGNMPINPYITCTPDISTSVATIELENPELDRVVSATIKAGTQQIPSFVLTNFTGDNICKFTMRDTSGSIVLNYREGRL